MDVMGSSLLDTMWPATNPFLAAQHSFSEMLQTLPREGPLSTLFFHYWDDEGERDALMWHLRDLIVSMSAQISWYLEDVLDDFPYLLLRL
eukprot:3698238-Pyramimonas_sp.AAC.1